MSPQGVCRWCGATWESMEKVCGEPAGWSTPAQNECMGGHCISKRAAAVKLANRKTERDRRTAVQPIRTAIETRRKARRAKRAKIAADRNNRGIA